MVPKKLQGILWSVDTAHLDLEKDAPYIVHQILSYGDLKEIRWLLSTYGKNKVKRIFLHYPAKTYTASGLNFVRKMILEISPTLVPDYKYDESLPRRLE